MNNGLIIPLASSKHSPEKAKLRRSNKSLQAPEPQCTTPLSPAHTDDSIILNIQSQQAAKLELGNLAYLWLDHSCGSTCVVSVRCSCSANPKMHSQKKQKKRPASDLAGKLFFLHKNIFSMDLFELLSKAARPQPHFSVNTFQSVSFQGCCGLSAGIILFVLKPVIIFPRHNKLQICFPLNTWWWASWHKSSISHMRTFDPSHFLGKGRSYWN